MKETENCKNGFSSHWSELLFGLLFVVYLVECSGCGLTRHFVGPNAAVESVEVVE